MKEAERAQLGIDGENDDFDKGAETDSSTVKTAR